MKPFLSPALAALWKLLPDLLQKLSVDADSVRNSVTWRYRVAGNSETYRIPTICFSLSSLQNLDLGSSEASVCGMARAKSSM